MPTHPSGSGRPATTRAPAAAATAAVASVDSSSTTTTSSTCGSATRAATRGPRRPASSRAGTTTLTGRPARVSRGASGGCRRAPRARRARATAAAATRAAASTRRALSGRPRAADRARPPRRRPPGAGAGRRRPPPAAARGASRRRRWRRRGTTGRRRRGGAPRPGRARQQHGQGGLVHGRVRALELEPQRVQVGVVLLLEAGQVEPAQLGQHPIGGVPGPDAVALLGGEEQPGDLHLAARRGGRRGPQRHEAAVDGQRGAVVQAQRRDHPLSGAAVEGPGADEHLAAALVPSPGRGSPVDEVPDVVEPGPGVDHLADGRHRSGRPLLDGGVAVLLLVEAAQLPEAEVHEEHDEDDGDDRPHHPPGAQEHLLHGATLRPRSSSSTIRATIAALRATRGRPPPGWLDPPTR